MRFRTLALAVALPGALAIAATPAAATSTPTPTNNQIQGLQAKVAALGQQISADSEKVQIAAEQYDQATARLQLAQLALKKLQGELATNRRNVVTATTKVRQAAVAAYVLGTGASAQFGAVLTKNIADSGTVDTYAGFATNTLHIAVLNLDTARAKLQASEQSQQREVGKARAASAAALTASNAAQAATNADKQALSQVKGNLAQAIAEYEARQAEIARQKELAAQRAKARAEAEAEAQRAAAVAEAVANGNSGAATAAAAATASADAVTLGSSGGQTLSQSGSSSSGNTAVNAAESFLGVPYVWGGQNSSGVDCSGLTMLAWQEAGVSLTHSAYYQYTESQPVSLNSLQPGDLLFYYFPNDGPDAVTHVAMYVGQGPYGTNTIIQAPQTGETVSYAPMYYIGFVGAGRP